jgi:hypothetical protein
VQAEQINESTIQWSGDHHLPQDDVQAERIARLRPGILAARVVAEGEFERVALFADYHTWLFAFDDAYCDEGALGRKPGELAAFVAGLVRVAEAPACALLRGNRFAEALRDIRVRLGQVATPVQVGRWVDGVRTYLSCQVWEATNRAHGIVPTLDDYALMRMHNGAMTSSIMLLDVVGSYEVPAAEMVRQRLCALVEMTSVLVGWDNDIYSHHKETLRFGDGQNLLDVLMRQNQCSLGTALADAIDLRDRIMMLFLALQAAEEAGGNAQVRSFVGALGTWVRANLEFSRTCDRYIGGYAIETAPSACTSVPPVLDPGPIPVDSLSWWWSLKQ